MHCYVLYLQSNIRVAVGSNFRDLVVFNRDRASLLADQPFSDGFSSDSLQLVSNLEPLQEFEILPSTSGFILSVHTVSSHN